MLTLSDGSMHKAEFTLTVSDGSDTDTLAPVQRLVSAVHGTNPILQVAMVIRVTASYYSDYPNIGALSKGSSGGFGFRTIPFYGVIPKDHVLYTMLIL